MTFLTRWKAIDTYLDDYNHFVNRGKQFNQQTEGLNNLARRTNLPEAISEGIARLVLEVIEGKICSTRGKGDLQCGDEAIQVKCFSSDGPTSFGPNTHWDSIYFIDLKNYAKKMVKCYRIHAPRSDPRWNTLPISKKRTFGDAILRGQRPRMPAEDIFKHFSGDVQLVFSGHMKQLEELYSANQNRI